MFVSRKKFSQLQDILRDVDQQIQTLTSTYDDLVDRLGAIELSLEAGLNRIDSIENTLNINPNIAKKASDEPWGTISISEITDDGRIGVTPEYNEAFIEYLKANGFGNSMMSDDDIVWTYFINLLSTTSEQVPEDIVDVDTLEIKKE